MLKRVFIVISVAVVSCFASIMPPVVVKNADENVKASRMFYGRVEKTGFWRSWFSDYKYRLYDKGQCIACLDFNEQVRSPEVLKAFVGKNVIVKGAPQYINKEPYLVITVDDVSEQ